MFVRPGHISPLLLSTAGDLQALLLGKTAEQLLGIEAKDLAHNPMAVAQLESLLLRMTEVHEDGGSWLELAVTSVYTAVASSSTGRDSGHNSNGATAAASGATAPTAGAPGSVSDADTASGGELQPAGGGEGATAAGGNATPSQASQEGPPSWQECQYIIHDTVLVDEDALYHSRRARHNHGQSSSGQQNQQHNQHQQQYQQQNQQQNHQQQQQPGIQPPSYQPPVSSFQQHQGPGNGITPSPVVDAQPRAAAPSHLTAAPGQQQQHAANNAHMASRFM